MNEDSSAGGRADGSGVVMRATIILLLSTKREDDCTGWGGMKTGKWWVMEMVPDGAAKLGTVVV